MPQTNDTISVPLTRGKIAVIDAADAPLIAGHRWVAVRVGRRWYALSRKGGGYTLMHRLLLDAPPDLDVDHWDGDGLNNRRSTNIRVATRSQNMANIPMRPSNRSGYRGVSWHAGTGKWRATIKRMRRQVHLGFFVDPAIAARAYDAAAREIFGEFARLNFPDDA